MASKRANKFKKINHHLKSKQIDEKLELLNEIPVNSTTGMYVVEPEYFVQDPDVQGLPRAVDFTQDALANGRDTTGLFLEDGTILTIEPPGDTSYILGPMASMWYAWGNFTTIGYIRQSDRRMVDLGRISGQLGAWDGSTGFNSYGQLTLAQAQWFKDTPKLNGANNDTPNYRAFYPGPPSNVADQYGRYLCVITGTPKPTAYTPPPRRIPPVLGGPTPNYANFLPGSGLPKQSGGILNKFWDSLKGFKNNMDSLKSNASRWMSDTISKFSGVSPQTITSIGNGIAKALQPLANITGKGLGGAVQLGFHGTSQAAADRILAPVSNLFTGKSGIAGFKPGSTQNIYRTSNVFAAPSGGTQAKGGMIPQVAQEFSRRGGDAGRGAISRAFSPQSTKSGAIIPTVLPKGSGPGMTIPGTKYAEISAPASKATKGTELANRVLSGSYANSAKAQQLIATGKTTASISGARGLAVTLGKAAGPAAAALVVADVGLRGASAAKNYSKGDYANAGLDAAGAMLGGLTIVPGPIGWTALAAQVALDGGRALLQREEYIMEEYLIEEQMNNYAQYYQDMTKLLTQALRSGLSEIGEISDSENQLISNIENGRISPEDGKAIESILKKIQSSASVKNNNLNMEVQESVVLTENRQKILKDLKKPYQLPEEKKEKIKHRPRIIGAKPNIINSDLMKQAEVPSSFKQAEERLWTKYNKQQNARWSQERKNQILDHLGGSDHAWEWLTETSKKKNKEIMYGNFGEKPSKKKVIRQEQLKGDQLLFIVDENGKQESILQSELSIKIADEMNKELFDKYFQEQETLQADKDPLFRKVKNRLNSVIDYPDKPAKLGYPNDPPPETVNGWHPEYGQKSDYYNKLDPQSADAMPMTGNPEIDAKVKRAKTLKKVLNKKA